MREWLCGISDSTTGHLAHLSVPACTRFGSIAVSAGGSKERSGIFTSPPLVSSAAPGLPGTLVFNLVFSPLLRACALAGFF